MKDLSSTIGRRGVSILLAASLLGLLPITEGQARTGWMGTEWSAGCTRSLQDLLVADAVGREAHIDSMLDMVPDCYLKGQVSRHGGSQAYRDHLRDKLAGEIDRGWDVCDQVGPESLRGRTAALLEKASVWLKGMGFGGPVITPLDDEVDTMGLGVPADCGPGYCAGLDSILFAHGYYSPRHYLLRLNLSWDRELAPVRGMTPRGASSPYVAVHEMFHAIQHGYEGMTTSDGLDWFTEGSATHVHLTAARKWGSMLEPGVEHRYYDRTLHRKPDEDCGEEPSWKYGSWYFWDFLGDYTGTTDGVAYLDAVLSEDLSAHNGLEGVHRALTQWHEDGLYDAYPEFVRQRLDGPRFFSADGVSRLELRFTGERLERSNDGRLPPMATRLKKIEIRVPPGETAGVRIDFEEDHEDLHLVVDGQRLDRRVDAGGKRNVYRTALSGRDEPYRLAVRVANVAPDPVKTERRDYTLTITLDPVDSCTARTMMAALDQEHFPAADRFHPDRIDPDRLRRPGQASMRFNGLVSDGGDACSHHIAALDMTGAWMTGRADRDQIERDMRARGEAMKRRIEESGLDRLAGQGGVDPAEMSPEQRRELMELAGAMQGMGDIMRPPDDTPADVVLNLYSPQAFTWQSGILPPPRLTRHRGLVGWGENSAAALVIQLPGTTAEDLEEGGVYPARAFASPPGDGHDPSDPVPTIAGFHTSWEGTFHDIPYPPPRTTAETRRQAQEKQACERRRRELPRLMERIGVSGATGQAMPILAQVADQVDCSVKGTAFRGETRLLTGDLEGTVTVHELTGAEVVGEFELSGRAQLHVTDWELIRDERRGVIDGDRKTTRRQSGPVSVEGSFSVPNRHGGQIRPIGYRTVVID